MRALKKLFLPLLLVLLASTNAIAADSATQHVKATVDDVLAIVSSAEGDPGTRRQKIIDVIKKRFAFASMAQSILATNWKKASDADKQAFTDVFADLVIFTYVKAIEAYSDEAVEFTGEKRKGSKTVVSSVIVSGSTRIPVDYKLKQVGDTWHAYDVRIEGVSMVNSYRGSFRSIIKKQGMQGLIARLREKVDGLREG